mmetsp:Transcript_4655/g.7462  ORF Transcript_4655/g.7462 Transcript_4655/m.7462 type:complete len:139 (+) Transcript_4655:1491-1907(+)
MGVLVGELDGADVGVLEGAIVGEFVGEVVVTTGELVGEVVVMTGVLEGDDDGEVVVTIGVLEGDDDGVAEGELVLEDATGVFAIAIIIVRSTLRSRLPPIFPIIGSCTSSVRVRAEEEVIGVVERSLVVTLGREGEGN